MDTRSCLRFLADRIHTVVLATVDDAGNPVTCAVDIMLAEDSSVFFLTAVGKSLYTRLKVHPTVALTGICGEDTMHSQSISLQGRVRDVGTDHLEEIFAKNPYMADIYPSAESRRALRVFELHQGQGEFFDLSVLPIVRESFSFGGAALHDEQYHVGPACNSCGTCVPPCPQSCIEMQGDRAHIEQKHCLRCGICAEVCPQQAIEKRSARS